MGNVKRVVWDYRGPHRRTNEAGRPLAPQMGTFCWAPTSGDAKALVDFGLFDSTVRACVLQQKMLGTARTVLMSLRQSAVG